MKSILFFFSLIALVSCKNNESEIVVQETKDSLQNISTDKYLVPAWYGSELLCFLDENGDTAIPFLNYYQCYSDTIREMGIVNDNIGKIWGINLLGTVLF